MRASEFNIRDPFVLVHDGKYYLYGSRSATCRGPGLRPPQPQLLPGHHLRRGGTGQGDLHAEVRLPHSYDGMAGTMADFGEKGLFKRRLVTVASRRGG